jgi:hypothetical protein
MARHLLKILGDDKLYKKMSAESLKIAGEHELSHTIEQFVTLYKHVIALHEGEHEREMAISSETQ